MREIIGAKAEVECNDQDHDANSYGAMVRVAATTVIMNADIAATSTFFTDGHNKASTLSRRLHSSSDTNGKQVNNQLIGTFDHNFEHENILSQISSSSSSSSTTSNNSERSMQCIDSLFDQVVSFDSIPYVSGSNQINDCRIVARSSTYGNKTASPTVLRAKLYPHSVEGKDHCHRSSLTPDCSTQNAQLTPNTGTINTNTEQVHSNVYDAIDCIGGANNVATESPVTIPLSTTCSGTFVGWHELRNKLIKIKKANRRRQFRKRSLTLSLPLSRSKQQSSSTSSSSNVQDVNSDRISGNVRLLINRGLLNEFRNKFRRFGHNRSWNSRLCLNNSIPKKTSSSVNFSYSYYNFFYYPERQLSLERIGNHSSNIDSTIRSDYNQSTPICTGHCEANHHYQTKYCEQSSSLTSLLSIGSGTTVSETSSTLKCCNGNGNKSSDLTDLNRLLPATNTQSKLSRLPLLHNPYHYHHHHHHHHHNHHRNSLYSSLLLDSDCIETNSCDDDDTRHQHESSEFVGHRHRRSSESNHNTCLSTIMEILPILLLLTMGVIISTTCAKYTYHSSVTPAAGIGKNVQSSHHHHYGSMGHEPPNHVARTSSTNDGTDQSGNGPDPPYLMMMQKDDEFASSSSSSSSSDHHHQQQQQQQQQQQTLQNQQQQQHTQTNQFHHQQNYHHHQQRQLAKLAHQFSAMQLNWISNSSITCNDGTSSGYYIRHWPSSHRWIIFLEGGWYCMSKSSCDQRWSKMREYMTSFRWTQYKAFNGILSSSPSINPYWWNANHVFIPYCSSDIWSGDSAAPNEMAFLGSRIIDEVISELIRSPIYRFVDAKFVLLAGSSAGAAGVMINLDRVARNIAESGSKADVRGLADSGWILENDYLEHIAAGKGAANKAPKQQTQQQSLPCTDAANCSPMESIRGAFKLWNSRVPTACTDRFPNEPWRCFFGYRLYPTLQTPLFVVQYQYDEFQIHVDGMTRGRVWNEHERLQYIRSLSDAIRYTLNNVSAVFAPSCMSHVVLTKPDWHKASVKGVTLPEALNCWEQTPIQINRFNGHNTMFQHQQHHHHHHHMHNKNGFHSNGKPINQYHQTTPSMKLFNSIYPYGIPVMSASGSNGNGNSGETEIENVDDDELSQYYSNGRAIHFGNYANTGQGSSSSANMPTSSKKSANNANYYNNLQLSDEMMSNDEPRKMSSTEIASTIQLKQSKNNSNGDENSIVVLNGTINSSLHKSLAISPTIVSNNNNNNKSLNQTNSGGGGGGSHSNNHQRKHDKRRKKRKRRKHSHRRFNSQTATSTISPITTVTSLLTNSIGNTKLKRNPMTKEENPIQPQNDQQSQLFHHGRSHAKKHRPNRMSMINPDGGRLPYNLNEPWKLSGGDDVEYHGYHHEPAQCRFRLIDDYTYPKTNTFACPSFYKD